MSTSDDPFARLGLPHRFSLSESEIRERQRDALGRTHPDRAADPVAKAMALRESAAISAAARCLLDARRRAEALLSAAGADAAPSPDPSLLMEMLEWRERVDGARGASDRAELDRARAEIEERVARIRRELAMAIDGPDGAPGGAGRAGAPVIADPSRAGALLTELRLVERLLEQSGGA